MAKINVGTYSDFTKNALVLWRTGYQRVAPAARALYDVRMSNQLTSDHSGLDGFTFAHRKTEGDDYYQENPTQNYSKTMTKYRIGLEAVITWEMRKYDKYREISRVLTNLGEAAAQRMELDLTHRFTFGTSSSYTDMDGETVTTTTGDGQVLFYSLHTVNGSSTTYRNIVANNPAFSKGGLEAAETLYTSQMIDSAGNKIVIQPDTIITTDDPNTVNLVKEFLNSTADPDGAHSGIVNSYKSKYRHIILPYMATSNVGAYASTKAKYWMLACVAHTDAILEISEEPHMISPTPGSNAEDFDNDDWRYKCSAAYGIEIVDPKWAVFSKGDGTA